MQRNATIQLRTSLYDDASAIVAQEYGTDLSLDDIARRVASSRRQLQRAYAEIGGVLGLHDGGGVLVEAGAVANGGRAVHEHQSVYATTFPHG